MKIHHIMLLVFVFLSSLTAESLIQEKGESDSNSFKVEPISISFKDLKETKVELNHEERRVILEYPEKILNANGKVVEISGFMSPHDDPKDMKRFTLMKSSHSNCDFCEKPTPLDYVFVSQSEKGKMDYTNTPVTVEGKLLLWVEGSELEEHKGGFVYILNDASCKAYEGDAELFSEKVVHRN